MKMAVNQFGCESDQTPQTSQPVPPLVNPQAIRVLLARLSHTNSVSIHERFVTQIEWILDRQDNGVALLDTDFLVWCHRYLVSIGVGPEREADADLSPSSRPVLHV